MRAPSRKTNTKFPTHQSHKTLCGNGLTQRASSQNYVCKEGSLCMKYSQHVSNSCGKSTLSLSFQSIFPCGDDETTCQYLVDDALFINEPTNPTIFDVEPH